MNAREGVAQRGRVLEAACLDQVDFGASQITGGASLGRNAAKLLLRRNEVKDQRKRWSSSKIMGEKAYKARTPMPSSHNDVWLH